MSEKPKINIKERRRIYKYAEGADPNVDEPIEVLEQENNIEGEQAEKLLREKGVNPSTIQKELEEG